jgi:long-chain acyl-CoA synthetase
MRGYWRQPQATAEVIRDGWFYTGDMGHLDSDGFLYITGRKKDMIVLSNGKKVTPSGVESLLLSEPHIEQAIVFGDHRNFLTAVIVPNWAKMRQTLSLAGSEDELAKDPRVEQFLSDRVGTVLGSTAAWEQVKKFVVRAKLFTPEGGEMTVSLKLKRDVIRTRHSAELDMLYNEETTCG